MSKVHLPLIAERVAALHTAIDSLTAPLSRMHAERLVCARGCRACCIDDLTVFEPEAALIRAHHSELLEVASPHAVGACAFLDDSGACRIYEHRPYVCRTQGLPLRWIAEDDSAGDNKEVVEHRDVCALNFTNGPAIETLPSEACWSIGPVENSLYDLASLTSSSPPSRTALRSLFSRNS